MGFAGSALQFREAAKALISTDDAVLLIKERHTGGTPFWTLPGGGVQRRELCEELDCHVYVGDAVDTVWYAHRSDTACVSMYTVYECQIDSHPTPNITEGVCEYRLVAPETLPVGTLPQIQLVCSRWRVGSSPVLRRG